MMTYAIYPMAVGSGSAITAEMPILACGVMSLWASFREATRDGMSGSCVGHIIVI